MHCHLIDDSHRLKRFMQNLAACALAVHGMQKEDALLVDIRGEAERAAQGLPDLQRNALGKGAIVPLDAINTAPASK